MHVEGLIQMKTITAHILGLCGDVTYIWIADSANNCIRRVTLPPRFASILGDPHFVGMAGGKYKLDMLPDHCYVIFTAKQFHWNTQLKS